MKATTTTTAPKQDIYILQDDRSKLFYNKDLGGFSEPNRDKATRLEGKAQVAFIKAHFLKPEFISALYEEDNTPSPENAHQNKHLNGTEKVRSLPSSRWDSRGYVFGDWQIEVYMWNQNKGAHAYLRSNRPNYVRCWNASNIKTKETFQYQDGGIKRATKKILNHEMKRHNLA